MLSNDTIAAIATPPGEGGISIVRVSGPDALKIADRVFHCQGAVPSERAANTFVHGFVRNPVDKGENGQNDIDEAILLIYRSPRSYTRENVIEIQGHGGNICAAGILRAVLAAGARIAEPGEFTKRAFLSGRLDLVQAEAVMDLIKSRSERASRAALEQLEGSLSNEFSTLYDQINEIAANLEATLDFEVDELSDSVMTNILIQLRSVREGSLRLVESWNEGHLLRDGATVVLAGKPNAGKSTLMNALLGKERAIVAHVPGTTRDTIEEELVINGIPVRLTDTAGLRETECDIEQESIRRSRNKMDTADITIWVIDGSVDIDESEITEIRKIKSNSVIVVINKSDLGQKINKGLFEGMQTVICGIGNQQGADDLRQAINRVLSVTAVKHNATISERHRKILLETVEELDKVHELISSGNEEFYVLAAGLLRETLERIGEITGRNYHENLLDTIFGNFCVGK